MKYACEWQPVGQEANDNDSDHDDGDDSDSYRVSCALLCCAVRSDS